MTGKDPEWISLDVEEVDRIKKSICGGKRYWPRVSFALAVLLIDLYKNRGPYFSVIDEINAMEGLGRSTRTKAATQFRRQPLFPLYHKHFFSASYLPQNLNARWGLDRGGNKDLSRMIEGAAGEFGHDPDLWQNKVVHDFVLGAYEERSDANRLTGEWIVFAMHRGENYYLGLSSHQEGAENPLMLRERLQKSCAWEYPFAFEFED